MTMLPSTTTAVPSAITTPSPDTSAELPVWRLNVLRVGYLVVGVGLMVKRWPLLLDHANWGLKEGTVVCMLVAMSVLALLGLRYPTRMPPILLFEVGWKLIWLCLVAVPRWLAGTLDAATAEQTAAVAWVVIILAVIPRRYVARQFIAARGEPWRHRL